MKIDELKVLNRRLTALLEDPQPRDLAWDSDLCNTMIKLINGWHSSDRSNILIMLSQNRIKYELRDGAVYVDGAFDFYSIFNFTEDGSLRFIGSGKHGEDVK